MLSVTLGPFALAINHLLLLIALALATLAGWLAGRRQRVNPERVLFGLFMLGLVIARLAFVIAYWGQYQRHPLGIIDIRDGGFMVWPGVTAVLIGTLLHGWKRPALRASLGVGVASGVVFWWLAGLTLNEHEDARLPEVTLLNAAGDSVSPSDYQGTPLVINLWATWCPPCRRAMPVLQAAQQANPEVVFLFVNQAEDRRDVVTFFTRQNVHLDNVLFDDTAELARQVGAAVLPTTLFYNAAGRLSGSHTGELSNASLKHYLDNISGSKPSPVSQSSIPRNTQ